MARGETYEQFVERFKPKKTTDDCYTPPEIYQVVLEWAVAEYGLEGRPIVRPFYPGGDYENAVYPENCVVIDNPPFSILAKIKNFYYERNIKYFLFAPHLTLFSNRGEHSYIVTNSELIYENGTNVKTSFVTNLDSAFIRTAPELAKAIQKAKQERGAKATQNKLPKYEYPKQLVTASILARISNIPFELQKEQCEFVRQLDAQKGSKKAIFGSGYFISEPKAKELKAKELKAKEEVIYYQLSEREQEIIRNLKD